MDVWVKGGWEEVEGDGGMGEGRVGRGGGVGEGRRWRCMWVKEEVIYCRLVAMLFCCLATIHSW